MRVALGAVCLVLLPLAVLTALGGSSLEESQRAARAGERTRAADEARTAGSFWPWSALPLQAEGEAQLAAGDVTGARAAFERAVAKDPGNWELWLDLARATDGLARATALAEAARLNPLSPELALLRTELEMESGGS